MKTMRKTFVLSGVALTLAPLCGFAGNTAEMVVTATRADEKRLDLPMAIDRVDGDQVALDDGAHIRESLDAVAGVLINQLSAGTSPGHNMAIRMPLNYGPYYLYLQDGVPVQAPGSFNHNALWWTSYSTSVSAIEVLKGPGTALYGSDAVGGTVNVLSEAPSEELERTLSVDVGEYAYRRLKAGVSDTTDSGHGWRIAVSAEAGDGWREKAEYERAEILLRHRYESEAGDRFDTIFTANRMDGNNQSALSLDQLREDPSQHGFADDAIDPYRVTNSQRLSTEWRRYVGDDGELTVTPYVTRTTNDYVATWVPDTLPENRSESTAVGVLSKFALDHEDGSETIVGFDLVTNRSSRLYFQSAPDTVVWGKSYLQGTIYDYEVDYLGLSPYLQHRRALGERLTVTAGLRYDDARFSYDNHLAAGDFGVYRRPADRDDDFDHLSPKLGLVYAIDRTSRLYARYARAFRVPQEGTLYSLTTSNAESRLDPETADNYEVGYKFQSGPALVEVAAYLMKVSDAIVTDSSDPGARFKTNAGSITHKGLELTLRQRLGEALALHLAYAFPRSEYDDFVSSGTDYSGNEMKMAPERIGNVRLVYTPPAVAGLTSELEWQDVGGWWMDDANTTWQGGYRIYNLRLAYELDERTTLRAKVLNLTGEEYVVQSDIAWGRARYYPGSPRIYYAGIDYAF